MKMPLMSKTWTFTVSSHDSLTVPNGDYALEFTWWVMCGEPTHPSVPFFQPLLPDTGSPFVRGACDSSARDTEFAACKYAWRRNWRRWLHLRWRSWWAFPDGYFTTVGAIHFRWVEVSSSSSWINDRSASGVRFTIRNEWYLLFAMWRHTRD